MKKLTRVQRKKRRQKIFLRIVLLIAIISFIFIFRSDFFIIDSINIDGNYIVSDEEIIAESRIYVGNHIFNYNKNEAIDRIKNFSYIKDADIKRSLPKTVDILVEEREVFLQFSHLSSYILVDNEGCILEIKDDKVENIPLFIGFIIEDHMRENILEEEHIKNLEAFLSDEDTGEVVGRMIEVIYEDEQNTNINLNNGIGVAFGPLSDVKYKLTLLNDILTHIDENDISTQTILMNKGENPIIVTDD